jgi:hypothetical protein
MQLLYLSAVRCREATTVLREAVVLWVQEVNEVDESVLNPHESFRLVLTKLVDCVTETCEPLCEGGIPVCCDELRIPMHSYRGPAVLSPFVRTSISSPIAR